MRGLKNKFNRNSIQHLYLRADDLGMIFYSVIDRLVYYTVSACVAKRHNITVAAASLMFTHMHQSVIADTLEAIECYLHDSNTSFARMYNNHYGRKGKLFRERPGIAQKYSTKDKRTNLIYVFNNQVEKKLCARAIEERWDFLPYFVSDHPFSAPIDLEKASKPLRQALKLVDRRVSKGKPLKYKDFDRIFAQLQPDEIEQFVDYVITQYKWIDYSIATSLFGNTDSLIKAIDSTTGSEYSINEEFTARDDTQYLRLLKHSNANGLISTIYTMEDSQKEEIANQLHNRYNFDKLILSKFFHIPKRNPT